MMPGFLLHLGAMVLCAHGGQAQPPVVSSRVKVSSQPVVTQSAQYTIAGCRFTLPSGSPMPCVTGQWITAATRVRANGEPVLLQDSQGICSPHGSPLEVVATQTRARGT